MPNQITHTALANIVFDKIFSKFDKMEFYIGNVFPDIRYLTSIDKKITHSQNITLNTILSAKTSFEAGQLFHCLTDDIFNKNVIDVLLVDNPKSFIGTSKLLADELLYNKIDNWSAIVNYFDNILPEELNYNISKQEVLEWHKAIKNIFRNFPNDSNRSEFMVKLNFSKNEIEKSNKDLAAIRKDNVIIKSINDFYNNFEHQIKT